MSTNHNELRLNGALSRKRAGSDLNVDPLTEPNAVSNLLALPRPTPTVRTPSPEMHTSIIVETVVVARNRRAARPPDMCNDPEFAEVGRRNDPYDFLRVLSYNGGALTVFSWNK